MRKLGDLRDIKSGQQATRLTGGPELNETKVRILSPAAIHEGYFDESLVSTDYVKDYQDIDRIYRLHKIAEDGDIIMKLSSPYEACLISRSEEDEDYVIPSYCCIIRNFHSNRAPEIPNEYICAVLNSDFTKKEIARFMNGINNPMLKIADIKNFPIPDMSHDEMEQIGALFTHSTKNRINLLKLIQSEEKILNNILYARMPG